MQLADGSQLWFSSSRQPNSHGGDFLVVCFHGSGDDAASSWKECVELIDKAQPCILFERSASQSQPKQHVTLLRQYLLENDLPGPYILIAHSSGGTFAKQFLLDWTDDIVGVLLVETGKAHDPKDKNWSGDARLMQAKPLAVISGDSLIHFRRDFDASEASQQSKQRLLEMEQFDQMCEKQQLALSTQARHIALPGCGHNVIRDRPELVAAEVQKVSQACSSSDSTTATLRQHPSNMGGFRKLTRVFQRNRKT